MPSQFLFTTAPFPSCHASTIAQTPRGLIAAFFAGSRESAPDVGIWISHHDNSHHAGSHWSHPTQIALARDDSDNPVACWNPVLHQLPAGPLLLFYKAGPKEPLWWGMLKTSSDHGQTWSAPQRLPHGILGPIKNKILTLKTGTLLSPSSTENNGWQIHIERSTDHAQTWTKSPPLNDGHNLQLIQPTLLPHTDTTIHLLCRSRHQKIYESWSTDAGQTWTPPTPTPLPNPNSGIDAVQLNDGRSLLVYNPSPTTRNPISYATSPDGKSWTAPITIEDSPNGQLSYPAVIQTPDEKIHITYTWKRQNIRHVTLSPNELPPHP